MLCGAFFVLSLDVRVFEDTYRRPESLKQRHDCAIDTCRLQLRSRGSKYPDFPSPNYKPRSLGREILAKIHACPAAIHLATASDSAREGGRQQLSFTAFNAQLRENEFQGLLRPRRRLHSKRRMVYSIQTIPSLCSVSLPPSWDFISRNLLPHLIPFHPAISSSAASSALPAMDSSIHNMTSVVQGKWGLRPSLWPAASSFPAGFYTGASLRAGGERSRAGAAASTLRCGRR